MEARFGARIVNLPGKTILIEQTRYNDKLGRYTIDHSADKSKIELHVKRDDDAAIGAAIRSALEGKLTEID